MRRRALLPVVLLPCLTLAGGLPIPAFAQLDAPEPRTTAKPKIGTKPAVTATAKPKISIKPPKYRIKVQIVRTADDDGGRASTLTEAKAKAAIQRANAVYRRNGGDVQFELHSASNFDELVKSTALNRDCIMASGQTDATINANTDGDLDNDGAVGTSEDRDILCDYTTSITARTAYAVARADRIIVWSRGGNDAVKWDGDAGHWVASHPTGGASSANGYYVRMPKSFGNDTLLAHEIGHYLHTAHTFGSSPKSIAEARQKMETWAANNPGKDPRDVFDGDSRVEYAVHDTPPDPRATLLMAVHGGDGCDPDPAKGRVTVPAKVNGETKDYVLEPDRANVMSYFKGCPGFDHHQSKGQYEQIHLALDSGNRKALVGNNGSSCYESSAAPGDLADTQAKLAALVRKISRCLILAKKPLPWEIVTGEIYSNPAVKRAGFVKKGNVAVHLSKENALLKSMMMAETEE
jgi:hypothetical protein